MHKEDLDVDKKQYVFPAHHHMHMKQATQLSLSYSSRPLRLTVFEVNAKAPTVQNSEPETLILDPRRFEAGNSVWVIVAGHCACTY